MMATFGVATGTTPPVTALPGLGAPLTAKPFAGVPVGTSSFIDKHKARYDAYIAARNADPAHNLVATRQALKSLVTLHFMTDNMRGDMALAIRLWREALEQSDDPYLTLEDGGGRDTPQMKTAYLQLGLAIDTIGHRSSRVTGMLLERARLTDTNAYKNIYREVMPFADKQDPYIIAERAMHEAKDNPAANPAGVATGVSGPCKTP